VVPVLFLLMMVPVVLMTMSAVGGERPRGDKSQHDGHQQKSH